MSLYAIGDVHGCCDQLRRLLDQFAFDPAADELWFVGDLVNRGADSLGTLRFVKQLGAGAACVLGNHDFHLMRFAAGLSTVSDAGMQAVLTAPDRDELLAWLYRLPLMKVDHERGLILVHAGLMPQWDVETASQLSAAVAAKLDSDDERPEFLATFYGDEPSRWSESLQGIDRLRFTVNAMTRMRYLTADEMALDLSCSEAPGNQPAGLLPWYDFAHRHNGYTVLFGHWAAHGFRRMNTCIALDSGCVWGGRLSAIRLEPGREEVFQIECD